MEPNAIWGDLWRSVPFYQFQRLRYSWPVAWHIVKTAFIYCTSIKRWNPRTGAYRPENHRLRLHLSLHTVQQLTPSVPAAWLWQLPSRQPESIQKLRGWWAGLGLGEMVVLRRHPNSMATENRLDCKEHRCTVRFCTDLESLGMGRPGKSERGSWFKDKSFTQVS